MTGDRPRLGSRHWVLGCSTVLTALVPGSAQAQTTPPAQPSAPAPAPAPAQPREGRDEQGYYIVVVGGRSIVGVLRNMPLEQAYDADEVAGYGASTVGEVFDTIREENGDDQPSVLVNGLPVRDLSNISDLPFEAIQRIETLPRGAAGRIGGAPGQRAYNIVLRNNVKTHTLTGRHEMATEGGWSQSRGEGILTRVAGRNRFNLSARATRSGLLLESERDFLTRVQSTPFAPLGNIIPAGGSVVAPGLSDASGAPVTVIGLPAPGSPVTLSSLVPRFNVANPSELERFRTLRGSSRPIDLSVSGNRALAEWLDLQYNGRASWFEGRSLNGLPTGRFVLPVGNPANPFGNNVGIAVSDPARTLRTSSSNNSQNAALSLQANRGDWRSALSVRYDRLRFGFGSDFTAPLAAETALLTSIDPFDGNLARLIPVSIRENRTRNDRVQAALETQKPLFDLWAGPILGRAEASLTHFSFTGEDSSGQRALSRTEKLAKVGLTLPLTSRERGVLGALGDSSLAVEWGRVWLGSFGSLDRHSAALDWKVRPWLQLGASIAQDERGIAPELLAAPRLITENVPYFDPQTGQTVEVTTINGGAAGLQNERVLTRRLSATARPWRARSIQFDVEYSAERIRNQLGALPLPSSAVVAAFPDRFVRDSGGVLTLVDSRSVNFARQDNEQLRFGFRASLPIGPVPPRVGRGPRPPRTRLQVAASHTILLESRTQIRAGLPEVDLLKGGAIGLGGYGQRHSTNANISLSKGNTGGRIEYRRRGISSLVTGTTEAPDRLSFGALSTLNTSMFFDLEKLLQGFALARKTRLTVAADNLLNDRQRVLNLAGETPQAYQPVRRDPLGRTVSIELRKSF